MPCTWNRWRISRALDTDKPLSSHLERHLQGCDACRGFFRFGSSLPQRSEADLFPLLSTDSGDLSRRILLHLDQAPAGGLEGRKRFPFETVPAVAAALTLTVMVLSVIFLRPAPASDLSRLNPLSEWGKARSNLSGVLARMDSPYRTELENLRVSATAAADFFRSFLDIRLGDEE